MKIKTIQSNYIQKSRIFLYPLLGIKRGVSVTPIETYMIWEGMYDITDYKLICNYHLRDDVEFQIFTEQVLMQNKYFSDFFELEDDTGVFIFNFEKLASEYQKIADGKYSQLHPEVKNIITEFFRNHHQHHIYMLSYLDPQRFIPEYANLLDVDIEILRQVGELCSIPNLEKEKLKVKQKIITFENDLLTNKQSYDTKI